MMVMMMMMMVMMVVMVIMVIMVMMLMMMMVMGRYPCLTYQSTLPSYLPSLLTSRSYCLITFFAQTVTLLLLSQFYSYL